MCNLKESDASIVSLLSVLIFRKPKSKNTILIKSNERSEDSFIGLVAFFVFFFRKKS